MKEEARLKSQRLLPIALQSHLKRKIKREKMVKSMYCLVTYSLMILKANKLTLGKVY